MDNSQPQDVATDTINNGAVIGGGNIGQVPDHIHNGVDSPRLNPRYFQGFQAISVTDATVAPTPNNPVNGTILFQYDAGSHYVLWAYLNNAWHSFSTSALPFTTAYFASEVDNGNSGTSKTIDWTQGNNQKITTTGSCTLTFTAPLGVATLKLRIIHENSATAYTYTWPGTVKWPGGVQFPTTNTANAVDEVALFYNGVSYYSQGTPNFS